MHMHALVASRARGRRHMYWPHNHDSECGNCGAIITRSIEQNQMLSSLIIKITPTKTMKEPRSKIHPKGILLLVCGAARACSFVARKRARRGGGCSDGPFVSSDTVTMLRRFKGLWARTEHTLSQSHRGKYNKIIILSHSKYV